MFRFPFFGFFTLFRCLAFRFVFLFHFCVIPARFFDFLFGLSYSVCDARLSIFAFRFWFVIFVFRVCQIVESYPMGDKEEGWGSWVDRLDGLAGCLGWRLR